jgi:hypothetical protein
MIDQTEALQIANRSAPRCVVIYPSGIRQTKFGWFFPFRAKSSPVVGSHGLIVNKANGKVCHLGSARAIDREIELYDKGYQFERYDLVIIECLHVEPALDSLEAISLQIAEPEFEHGTVWRIPRLFTRDELRVRLSAIPCVFGNQALNLRAELLEEAKDAGLFKFEVFEYNVRTHWQVGA